MPLFLIDSDVHFGQDHHGQETDHGIDQADIHQISPAADRRLPVAGFPGIFSRAGQAGSGYQ